MDDGSVGLIIVFGEVKNTVLTCSQNHVTKTNATCRDEQMLGGIDKKA